MIFLHGSERPRSTTIWARSIVPRHSQSSYKDANREIGRAFDQDSMANHIGARPTIQVL